MQGGPFWSVWGKHGETTERRKEEREGRRLGQVLGLGWFATFGGEVYDGEPASKGGVQTKRWLIYLRRRSAFLRELHFDRVFHSSSRRSDQEHLMLGTFATGIRLKGVASASIPSFSIQVSRCLPEIFNSTIVCSASKLQFEG